MKQTRLIVAYLLTCLMPLTLCAQNGSNSPYSRFGLGMMADQSQPSNRGMGGVAYGLHSGTHVNALNPASYSAIDSLSFIFDMGLTLQFGKMSQGDDKITTRNTTLTNINAAFRLRKNLGMSLGFMPYTTIGYTYEVTKPFGTTTSGDQIIASNTTYSGNGGLQQLYMGIGWRPFKFLSVGMNASYVWGTYNHITYQTFSENSTTNNAYNSQNQYYNSQLRTYKLDFGIQSPISITSEDELTIGATYTLGHKIGGETSLLRYTSAGDTTSCVAKKAFDLPHTIGAGLAYRHQNKLMVAGDVTFTKWGTCNTPTPVKDKTTGEINLVPKADEYENSLKYAIGTEYIPDPRGTSHEYLKTMRYRAGFSYNTPYLKANDLEGPVEYRTSIGLGFPLQGRKLSGRSIINFSAEWLMRKPSNPGLIKENYVVFNIGLSFNERWFLKWKVN